MLIVLMFLVVIVLVDQGLVLGLVVMLVKVKKESLKFFGNYMKFGKYKITIKRRFVSNFNSYRRSKRSKRK